MEQGRCGAAGYLDGGVLGAQAAGVDGCHAVDLLDAVPPLRLPLPQRIQVCPDRQRLWHPPCTPPALLHRDTCML